MQAMLLRIVIALAELFRWPLCLVTTDANANDTRIGIAQTDSCLRHALYFFRAEMANCIDDPQHAHAEVALAGDASPLCAREKRLELFAAPMQYSSGDVHLGMNNFLRRQ